MLVDLDRAGGFEWRSRTHCGGGGGVVDSLLSISADGLVEVVDVIVDVVRNRTDCPVPVQPYKTIKHILGRFVYSPPTYFHLTIPS